jgi:FkbH-like protein
MLNDSNFEKIKLIIWDLDDTLWEGILAEGEVKPNEQAFELIKRLNQRGIVSSICSKNDRLQVVEYLKKIGSLDDFVFMSINYDSKAPRTSKIIDDMNLRAENCLFVDDNERNLGEVSFVLPSIMTSTPDIIGILLQKVDSLGKNDADLSRLKQYKVLEKKVVEQEKSFDEVDFLEKSNIRIAIQKNSIINCSKGFVI